MDGSSWRVVIEIENKEIESSGRNKGANNFDVFFKVVGKLLGGVIFY